MNIIKWRYFYFALSLLVIIPGIIAFAIWGFPLAIDFTGGSMLQIHFDNGVSPQPAEMLAIYDQYNVSDAQVQTSGNGDMVIRSKDIDEETKTAIINAAQTKFATKITVLRFEIGRAHV
jgi:preprotein translocase subunit SecF